MALNELNLQERLGDFPLNCNDQQTYLSTLLATLDTYLNSVKNISSETIVLAQASEPTQAQWETKWLETHEVLPISPSAILIWHDTVFNRVGKVYGTLTGVGGVLSREPNVPNGSTVVLTSDILTTAPLSTNSPIGSVAGLPSIDFYLPTRANVILSTNFYTSLSSGTGQWGVDFLLDGVKVGSEYAAIPVDYGINNYNVSSVVACEFMIQELEAGDHTVELMFGISGSPSSPPTVAYTHTTPLALGMYLQVRAVSL